MFDGSEFVLLERNYEPCEEHGVYYHWCVGCQIKCEKALTAQLEELNTELALRLEETQQVVNYWQNLAKATTTVC